MGKNAQSRGFLHDLYELMDADGDFSREDYFSCIFEVALGGRETAGFRIQCETGLYPFK